MSGSLFFNQWSPRILGISCPRAAFSDAVNRDKCYVRNGFKELLSSEDMVGQEASEGEHNLPWPIMFKNLKCYRTYET